MIKKPVYLDYHATTPVDPLVFKAMAPFFTDYFGNPGSTHYYGDIARNSVEESRGYIANTINADQPEEIVFTSGATESNNIAIQGIARFLQSRGKTHIITSQIEHKSVLDVVSKLDDFEVTYLTPNSDGTFKISALINAIQPNTGFITLMHANNEIGIINPIEKIGVIAEERNILFHCDVAQSLGKLPIDVKRMNVDILSMSAHKIYGPKGIGILYQKNSRANFQLEALFHGGGQEQGLRPGTVSPALVVGLAEALKLSVKNMKEENQRISKLRDYLFQGLKSKCQDIILNGTTENRLPNNLNISILGVPSESLMINLRDKIAVSNGSACTNYAPMPSHVLKAMGVEKEIAESAIRFGLGRFTTFEEIEYAIECIGVAVTNLRHKIAQAHQ